MVNGEDGYFSDMDKGDMPRALGRIEGMMHQMLISQRTSHEDLVKLSVRVRSLEESLINPERIYELEQAQKRTNAKLNYFAGAFAAAATLALYFKEYLLGRL